MFYIKGKKEHPSMAFYTVTTWQWTESWRFRIIPLGINSPVGCLFYQPHSLHKKHKSPSSPQPSEPRGREREKKIGLIWYTLTEFVILRNSCTFPWTMSGKWSPGLPCTASWGEREEFNLLLSFADPKTRAGDHQWLCAQHSSATTAPTKTSCTSSPSTT